MADNMTDREWMLWTGVYVRALSPILMGLDAGARRRAMDAAARDADLVVEHVRDRAALRVNEATAPEKSAPPVGGESSDGWPRADSSEMEGEIPSGAPAHGDAGSTKEDA